jgi:hypothetical protein
VLGGSPKLAWRAEFRVSRRKAEICFCVGAADIFASTVLRQQRKVFIFRKVVFQDSLIVSLIVLGLTFGMR